MMLPNGGLEDRHWLKDWYPGTAITLGELMQIFAADTMHLIATLFEEISVIATEHPEDQSIPPEGYEILASLILSIREIVVPLDLGNPVKAMDRLVGALRRGTLSRSEIGTAVSEVSQRIKDDLEEVLVLQVPKDRSRYYKLIDGFGQDVASSFPAVGYDLEEAHTCLALGRYNATVYHLMRVLEIGVQRLGDDLGVPSAHQLTWGDISNRCHSKTKALSKGPAKTKREEALNHLDGVRLVWRNPTMHPRPSSYTEEQTRDILLNAKALMVSLAEFL